MTTYTHLNFSQTVFVIEMTFSARYELRSVKLSVIVTHQI
jgi:hypothetical protein